VTTIIDGKAFSANLRGELARRVGILKQKHSVTPGLAVVLVGEDPASHLSNTNSMLTPVRKMSLN
jgi:methylenetetrahydrofolate dehydrogenase (NADP+)/methenyltetrahydrofolate cyclohydrolase